MNEIVKIKPIDLAEVNQFMERLNSLLNDAFESLPLEFMQGVFVAVRQQINEKLAAKNAADVAFMPDDMKAEAEALMNFCDAIREASQIAIVAGLSPDMVVATLKQAVERTLTEMASSAETTH